MSLEIVRPDAHAGDMVADRRLYVAADEARLVEDGDPAAAFLLACGTGDLISAADVKRFGLTLVGGRVVQGAAEPEPTASVIAEAPAPAPVVPPVSGSGKSDSRKRR
jgi:hypothetical protein